MKIFVLFILMISNSQIWANVQIVHTKTFSGSWINNKIIQYYNLSKVHACEDKFFESNDFVPLYLSFKGKDRIEITFRYEQKKGIYYFKISPANSIIANNGKRTIEIKFSKNGLDVEYEGKLLSFNKVSSYYSNDVFGEFIKSLIFEKHSKYILDSFDDLKELKNKVFNRSNFQQSLKEMFKCDAVEIAQLGLFKYKDFCLPEIAIYYDNIKNKWKSPRLLGVIREENVVKFIDSAGTAILVLKSR